MRYLDFPGKSRKSSFCRATADIPRLGRVLPPSSSPFQEAGVRQDQLAGTA